MGLLETLDGWITDIPPVAQQGRFGNASFRTWHERLVQVQLRVCGGQSRNPARPWRLSNNYKYESKIIKLIIIAQRCGSCAHSQRSMVPSCSEPRCLRTRLTRPLNCRGTLRTRSATRSASTTAQARAALLTDAQHIALRS